MMQFASRLVQRHGKNVRNLVTVAALAAGFGTLVTAQGTSWTLVWGDEFDAATINTADWNVENSATTTYGGSLQYYTPSNVVLQDGVVKLLSKRETLGSRSYTSGAITTKNKRTFGGEDFRLEVRAKLPGGKGVWPAIWTREGSMPNPDTGIELDLMELLGHEPNRVYLTQHVWSSGTHAARPAACEATDFNYTTGFHTYVLEQSSGSIRWYIDGVQKCISSSNLPVLPSYLMINTSLGGSWPDLIGQSVDSSTPFPQSFDVDFVRIYRKGTGTADTTDPSVALSSPTSGVTLNGTTTLTATASDNVGVSAVWFTVDGATVGAEDTTAPYSASFNTSTVGNGSHVIRAMARDAAGNTASSTTVTITINNPVADIIAPTVSVTTPTLGSILSGVITVGATASDNVGVVGVQFTVDGVNIGAEDTTAPYNASWTTTGVTNGLHVVRATARDAAGNTATATAISVTVTNIIPDLIAPTASVTAPSGGSTVSGTVALTAAAADNVGVAGVQFTVDGANVGAEDTSAPYSVNWNSAGVSNATHTIRAIARDAAGNSTTSATVTVTVNNVTPDTTSPAVSVTAPSAGSTVSGTVMVTANATDNVGIAGVQFTLDSMNVGSEDTSAPYSISWNTTTASNGTHTLRAIARDAAGNTSTASAISITVNNVTADTTLPSVSVTAPASNSTVSGNVTLSASASDNVGVVGVQFTIDNVNVGAEDATSPYSIAWASNTVSNGSHTVRAIARDAAGNSRTSFSRTITVTNVVADTTLPSVTVTSPAGGENVAGTVTLTASASDNIGVVAVQFYIDGVTVGAEDTSAPYSRSWSSSASFNGSHVVTAVARDAAGNTRTSAGVTIGLKNLGSGVAGDLNDDGIADLVFQHATGALHTWLLNTNGGLASEGPITPGSINPIWQIVALDDFDGDRKSDILWQNSATGQLYIWKLDRRTLTGEGFVSQNTTPWRVITTGDFNRDGSTDVVWMSPSGSLAVWYMQGTTMASSVPFGPGAVDPSWRLAGTGDLNRDGSVDLVWQNRTTGDIHAWLMGGTTIMWSGPLTPGATNPIWEVRAVLDLDDDGTSDLLFRHSTTGQLYTWRLAGTALSRDGFFSPSQIDPAWQVVGQR